MAATQQVVIEVSLGGADDPAHTSAAYNRQRDKWDVVDDVEGGTEALRAKGEEYLARAPGESDESYDRRLKRSHFYNYYRRTLTALVGRVMRKPPKLSDKADPILLEHAENINGEGEHHVVFARRFLRMGMHYGFGGILVDAPPPLEAKIGRKPTRADEKRAGQRPHWKRYSAREIISFRPVVVDGVKRLGQLVLHESRESEVGAYGITVVDRFIVLNRNTDGTGPRFTIWERMEDVTPTTPKQKTKARYRAVSSGQYRNTIDIPFARYHASDPKGWFESDPALIDLAELNLDHYNVTSDHRHSLHVASIPIAIFKGRDKTKQVQAWGVEHGIDIDGEGADAFYLEHEGKALEQTRQELLDIENRMGFVALSMMARRTNQAETAEAKRIDGMEQGSALEVMARGLQDTLEEAWGFHAAMIGLPAPDVKVNIDFDGLSMSPEQIAQARESWLAGAYSLDTFLDILEAGGALPEEFDREVDGEKLADEMAARLVQPTPGAGGDLGGGDGQVDGNGDPTTTSDATTVAQ